MREKPSNLGAREALTYDLLEAGYFRESLEISERGVDLDPLSGVAHARLSDALVAVGRTSEAIRSAELAIELGVEGANIGLALVNLREQRYEVGIAQLEAFLKQRGVSSSWVRETVTGASDPKTGQAYLDRRTPEIVASMSAENAYLTRLILDLCYLQFGFIDRYFELILAHGLTDSSWTDADVLIFNGALYRESGFTAHPKYLEVAGATGLVETWEQRGPLDFCEKLDGQWACE